MQFAELCRAETAIWLEILEFVPRDFFAYLPLGSEYSKHKSPELARRRVVYSRLRNSCSPSAALAIDRAKLSLATLCANTLLITSSSAEVRDSWACTTSTLSVTPASNRCRVSSNVSLVTCRVLRSTA